MSIKQTVVTAEEYFGVCPKCGHSNRYRNIGGDHWGSCDTHRTRWPIGVNLFSSRRDEVVWKRNLSELEGYEVVESQRTPRARRDALMDLLWAQRLSPMLLPTIEYPEFGRLFKAGLRCITGDNVGIIIFPSAPEEGRKLWKDAMAGCPDAANTATFVTPNLARGLLVRAAFRARMPVPAFREMLTAVWDHDHSSLTHFAKVVAHSSLPKKDLREMFEYAAYNLSHLPETLTVYRGGMVWNLPSGRPTGLQSGVAWTLNRDLAAWFAVFTSAAPEWVNDGPWGRSAPLILKAEVPRSRILAHITTRNEDECIIFGMRGAQSI